MKEKKRCKIIQDLLPNYIEKLTNEETNKYIEEHLKECTECKQTLENMQKNIELDNSKRNKQEVKYLKKFNRRLKMLRNIVILIVLLVIMLIARKTIILTNISNKVNEAKDENNYYIRQEAFCDGEMIITETYYKEDRILITKTTYSENGKTAKYVIYKSGNEKFILMDDGETKILKNLSDVISETPSYTSKNLLENIEIAIRTNIEKINLKGRKCYMLREADTERFIDANTGLTVKIIYNDIDSTINYEYKYGVVKDSDIVKPDTTGYRVSE